MAERHRKPLDEACDGGIFCPVENHVERVHRGARWTIRHIALTRGQMRTLYERRMKENR